MMDDEIVLKHRKKKSDSDTKNEAEKVHPTIVEEDESQTQVYADFKSSFWLTRVMFVRCLSLVYYVAFMIAIQQNKPLIGDNGLTPIKLTLEKIQQKGHCFNFFD